MTNTMNHQSSKLLALVRRHLGLESRLAASLDELNQATAKVLSTASLKAPTLEVLESLRPMSESLKHTARETGHAREVLLSRINLESATDYSSIKQYILSLPPGERNSLNDIRVSILDRMTRAQANLIHNQAMLFYMFDFHRKYLSGILDCDLHRKNYGSDGHQQDVHPGNIFGKTC